MIISRVVALGATLSLLATGALGQTQAPVGGAGIATPVSVSNGGTACSAASPTCVDNIAGGTHTGGTNAVFDHSPTLVTPALGAALASSLAINGCTIGANGLCVTGAINVSGAITGGGNVTAGPNSIFTPSGRGGFGAVADGLFYFDNNAATAFSGLILGPHTSAFPCLTNTGTQVNFVIGGTSSCGATASPIQVASVITVPIPTASLPSCTSGLDGERQYVNDSATAFTSANFGATFSGSGTNHGPVWCDGSATAWKIG